MNYRRATHFSASFVVIALALALATSGCSKKKIEDASKKLKEKAAEVVKKVAPTPAKPKVAPLPEDVELKAGDAVVAWVSFRSVNAAFDALETVAGKLGLAPPGASLRESAMNDLTLLLANNGITGHDWIAKGNAVHVLFQDDDPKNPQGGAVVLLPVTAEKAALSAMKAAKTGAEAKGHRAIVAVQGRPVFVDFVDKYMVLSSSEGRFKKVQGFIGRLLKIKVPALAYVGLSVSDVVKTRKNEVAMMLNQLERAEQSKRIPGASADYYNGLIKEYLASLLRVELTLDGGAEKLSLGVRLHAKAGSKLAKQLAAGRGKNATGLASTLPANSYFSFVAAMDPSAAQGQLAETTKMFKDMFKLDDKQMGALEADLRTAMKLTDGTSGMSLYPDGDAALGLTSFAGARDPAAVLKVLKRALSLVLIQAMDNQIAEQKKHNPKVADDPKLAIVRSAIQEMKIDPLLKSFGPLATQSGVVLTANTSKKDDVSCDVLDMTFDWDKLSKHGGKDAKRGQFLIGARSAVSLCTSKQRLSFSMGPSALEQGRRVAMVKAGGLADAPVYKAAIKASIKQPSWLMYANLGAGVAAYKKAFPQAAAFSFPADRAVVMGCGSRARSYGCQIDVPVSVIRVFRTLFAR